MEDMLTQDVDALGLRGEVVNVARGYARNFLLPRGLAQVASPGLKRDLERREAQRARHEAKTVEEARAIASRLEPGRDRAGLLDRLRFVPRALRLAALEVALQPRARDLRQPARQEEVPRVPAGDVDDLAAQAERVDVLRQHVLHRLLVPDVGQERELARPLHCDRDLALVAPARAADAAVADLALLRHVAPELVDV